MPSKLTTTSSTRRCWQLSMPHSRYAAMIMVLVLITSGSPLLMLVRGATIAADATTTTTSLGRTSSNQSAIVNTRTNDSSSSSHAWSHTVVASCLALPELNDDTIAAFGPTVNELTVSDCCNMTRIGAATLTGMRQLRVLRLTGNAIAVLERWAPHYFNALETLDVSDNRLATVAADALGAYPNMQTLRLSANRLQRLPDNAFAGTTRLLHIDLGANRLTGHLSAHLLAGLARLQTLSLAGNRLEGVEPLAFAGCTMLRELRLEGNAFGRLDGRLFAPLARLEVLNVSGNALVTLERDAFAGCHALRTLDVSDNRLQRLEVEWADGLSSLETLDLSRNRIGALPPFDDALVRLRRLNVSANQLTAIPDMTFGRLVRLEHIDLSRNRIATIATGAFAALPLLSSIDLAHNALDTEEFLRPVQALRHLSMAYNRFHTMNLTTFFHFHNVDLAGNPWSCMWLIEEMMVAADGIYFGKNYSIDGASTAPHPMTVPGIDCTDETGQLRSIVVLQVPTKLRNSYAENVVVAAETTALSPADKTIRKLIDNEFDYKACLIWTAVGVIAVFSLVHLGKVFFARSEKKSEKYRLSQQVGLLTTIETTLSMPPKFPPTPAVYRATTTPTTAPSTPLTPMVPPLTPLPSPQPHAPVGVLKANNGDKQRQQRHHQHNVYFAPQDNAPRVKGDQHNSHNPHTADSSHHHSYDDRNTAF